MNLESSTLRRGAIVLCGGRSTRMGRDKASLPFGPETMLGRVVRLLGEVVETRRIVVVAARDQALPPLPPEVVVARDGHDDCGPLEGLAAGLRAIGDRADIVYATSCDVPLLVPAFVGRMFDHLGAHEIAVPRDTTFTHPLAAVYRTTVLARAERLLAADRRKLRLLLDEANVREVPVAALRDVDPTLGTLENLNTPEDYRAALDAAGLHD
jgi:molybdopterin-guanine dinucleotide biosynthesis protein A